MPHVVKQPEQPKEPKGPRLTGTQPMKAAPSSINPIGRWTAFHPICQGPFDIKDDGSFTSTGNTGTWTFDGRYLTLRWGTNRPPEILELQGDGTFYRMCQDGSFTLRRA